MNLSDFEQLMDLIEWGDELPEEKVLPYMLRAALFHHWDEIPEQVRGVMAVVTARLRQKALMERLCDMSTDRVLH